MEDLHLTLIQSDTCWEDVDRNLDLLDRKIDAIPGRTELVVLPEMFATGFSMEKEKLAEAMTGKTVTWMKRKAQEKNIILTGSVIIRDGDRYYNRLLWVLPNGTFGQYDKRHLFSYAEEDRHYTPGQKKLIARVKGWKVCLSVCYDLRFPVWLRQPPEKDNRYDLLVCVANWPESRAGAWNGLLQARAIENQCFVAGVNRTGTDGNGLLYGGDSSVISPSGALVARGGPDESVIRCRLDGTAVQKERTRFPFQEDADNYKIY